jgi:outer membrane protein TolC
MKPRRIVLFTPLILLSIMMGHVYGLTLGEGLMEIAEKAREVRVSQIRTMIAGHEADAAKSRLLPSVDLHAEQTWLRYRPEAFFGIQSVPVSERDFMSYGVSFRQTLFNFGGLHSQWKSAEQMKLMQEENETETRNRIALEFINAYFDVLEAEKLLSVAEKEVERLRSHHSDTLEMFNEGLVTKNDLLQSDVALASAGQHAIDARNRLDVARSRLNILLLRDIDVPVDLAEVEMHPSRGIILEDAMTAAIKNRGLIHMIDRKIRAKELELRSLRAAYLPAIYLGGGYEYEENEFMLHEGNWSVTAGLQWNIFSGGIKKSRLQKAREELSILKLKRGDMVDRIRLAIKRAYFNMKSAEEKVNIARKSIDQAEENLRLYELKYAEGLGTSTDVIDAVMLLTKAETGFMRAGYDYGRAEAAFMYAAGMDLIEVYR